MGNWAGYTCGPQSHLWDLGDSVAHNPQVQLSVKGRSQGPYFQHSQPALPSEDVEFRGPDCAGH